MQKTLLGSLNRAKETIARIEIAGRQLAAV